MIDSEEGKEMQLLYRGTEDPNDKAAGGLD